jgi:hypothetical protein
VNTLLLFYHDIYCLHVDAMLTKKLKRAENGLKATKPIYEEHCMYVGQRKQELYLEKEKKAQRERGEALKIYEVSWADGKPVPLDC